MDNLHEQFSLIYDQYIEKIYRFVYLKVNTQEAAEDITSKVFLKGWQSYQSGQDIKNVGAFLYQIARNSVVDHYREGAKATFVSTDLVAQIADQGASIHDRAVLGSDMAELKAALQNLKKEYQDIIILHYLEDMPMTQIAEVMDKPAGTVRVMAHRGLKALKDELVKEV